MKHDFISLRWNLDNVPDEEFSEYKKEKEEIIKGLESQYYDLERQEMEVQAEFREKSSDIQSDVILLADEITEMRYHNRIEEIRKKSEYWANEFMERYEAVQTELKEEEEKYKENLKNDESWKNTYPSPADIKKTKVKTGIALASAGFNPDAITEMSTDIDATLSVEGAKFFEDQDKLTEQLQNMSYEEAIELNENLYKSKEVNQKTYNYLKSFIRLHYKV